MSKSHWHQIERAIGPPMSRPERTPGERKHIDLFLSHLNEQFADVVEDDSITDRPDLVVNIDGRRVGCELTTLTVQEYEKWTRGPKRLNKLETYSLDNAPGRWASKSISKKDQRIAEYMKESRLDDIWLLIHFGDLPVTGNDEETLAQLRYECARTTNGFSQIWLIGEKGHIERLWVVGDRPPRPGKPVHSGITHKAMKVQLGAGETSIDLGDADPAEDGSVEAWFLRAAYFNDLRTIETYIAIGFISLDFKDQRGLTALRYAAGQGHSIVVQRLLDAGAQIEAAYPGTGSLTLAELCDRRGHHETAEILRSHQR